MPDRDKVIKDLKEYRDRDYIREGTNYFDNDPRYRRMIIDNALALLEDGAVKPIKQLDKDDYFTFMCGNCKGNLFCGYMLRDNFCPTCGKLVKWDA